MVRDPGPRLNSQNQEQVAMHKPHLPARSFKRTTTGRGGCLCFVKSQMPQVLLDKYMEGNHKWI